MIKIIFSNYVLFEKAQSPVDINDDKYTELKWFMNEEFSDFEFIVEDKRIPVSKALLSIKSDFFRTMLAHTEMTEIPKYRNRSVFAKSIRLWFHMSRKN